MAAATARRIRVVHLADLVNRHDFIDAIVEHADPRRFDMRVATFSATSNIADPMFADRGVETIDLRAAAGRRRYPPALHRLIAYLRREQIDIVHTHHFDPAIVGWLATRASAATLIVGRHYSDAIYLSTSGAKRWAHLTVEDRFQRSAAAVVVPSQMIADLVVRSGVGHDLVHVVPYAFVPAKFATWTAVDMLQARARVGLASDRFIVGTFARLYRDKGHTYLLEAIRQLAGERPDLLWLVVGDGAEGNALRRAVDRAGLDRHVQFTGWRPDALALMAGVDIVVQPTLQEAFSSVMAEAMWLRRPLVITEVSGAVDIVVDGQNGLLVRKRDPAALAHAIRRLATDGTLRETLARNGHDFVTTHLTPEKVVPQYERVYEAVFGASTHSRSNPSTAIGPSVAMKRNRSSDGTASAAASGTKAQPMRRSMVSPSSRNRRSQ